MNDAQKKAVQERTTRDILNDFKALALRNGKSTAESDSEEQPKRMISKPLARPRPAQGAEAADVLRSPKGHLLAHSSALMHGGHAVSSGVRYILVAFCTIHPEHSEWASRFYAHVKDVIDPGDEDGNPPDPNARPLPRGLLAGGAAYRMALDGKG